MGDYIKAILDALKSPRLVLPVAVSAWFLALGKPRVMASLGLTDFRTTYHAAITLTAIVSSAVLLGQILGMAYDSVAGNISRRSKASSDAQEQFQILRNLTDEEKRYLQAYFITKKDSLTFPLRDGVVGGLVRQSIMFHSSPPTGPGGQELVSTNLEPWVRKTLTQHDELLHVPPFDPGLEPYVRDFDLPAHPNFGGQPR